MANVDRPMGFRPVKTLSGMPWTGLIRAYVAADRSALTTLNHGDIYIGDAVKLVSGKVLPAVTGDTVLGVAVSTGVTVSTFGQTAYYNPNNLAQRYLGYADTGVVGVVPAEGVLFEVQEYTSLSLLPGSLADICGTSGAALTTSLAHGNRTTSMSTESLKAAVSNDVMVVEQQTAPDNDATATKGKFIVRFYKTMNASN